MISGLQFQLTEHSSISQSMQNFTSPRKRKGVDDNRLVGFSKIRAESNGMVIFPNHDERRDSLGRFHDISCFETMQFGGDLLTENQR